MTRLHEAVIGNRDTDVEELLKKDLKCATAKNEYGITAEDLAYSIGDPDIIKIFKSFGYYGPASREPQQPTSGEVAAAQQTPTAAAETPSSNTITIGSGAKVNCADTIDYGIIAGGPVTITSKK